MSQLLYIFTHAPYGNTMGQEGLDAVLAGATFEQELSLLFLHDGVYQLKTNQQTQDNGLKPFTKAYAALDDFGVQQLYIHDLSLTARGIGEDELIVATKSIDTDQVRELIAQYDKVFTF